MLLFIIFGALVVIGIVCRIIDEFVGRWSDLLLGLALFCIIIGILGLLFITPFAIAEAASYDTYLAELNEERHLIEHQAESGMYLNDNNIGSVDIYSKISEFNKTIIRGRSLHNNPWVNVFYGGYYNEIELINPDIINSGKGD